MCYYTWENNLGTRIQNVNWNNPLTRVLILGSNEVSLPKKPHVEIKWVALRGAMSSCTMRKCTLNFACEAEIVCQNKKYFVIPVFKDHLSNLIDLFLKTRPFLYIYPEILEYTQIILMIFGATWACNMSSNFDSANL